MATSSSGDSGSQGEGSAGAQWLGVIAILFGVLAMASHGNEWLVQTVIAPDSAAAQGLESECPEDELAEEGVSADECRLMVDRVHIMIASRPDWFRPMQINLALAGTVVALASILVGLGLVDTRSWAAGAAVWSFGALLAIDIAQFIAAVNTGPLLRATYLWNLLLWFFIHLCMTVAAAAERVPAEIE